MSEDKPKVCPKCGGEMVEGGVTVPIEKMNVPAMDQLTPGFMHQGLPPGIETFATAPVWEERTGEKKGFIIKRPEVKKMKVVGHRCSLCNFIEFYAKP
jgi:predicted nucleic-acid-binding Zn-ribbon protein